MLALYFRAIFMTPWFYQNQEVTECPEAEGFVYLITRKSDGKAYVGKKTLRFKKRQPPLKGKKRPRISWIESDWRTYWGSSAALSADVALLGEDAFTREILHLCQYRSEMSYLEAKEQFARDVLTGNYYNGIIAVKIGRSNLFGKAS